MNRSTCRFIQDLILVRRKIDQANISQRELGILEGYVLLLEDRRFFLHFGFDVLSIARSLFVSICGGYGGGASTIEQQLVRTITNRRERTTSRKIREIFLAFVICIIYKKEIILKTYLEMAYFGWGIEGVSAASERLFKKAPYNLLEEEAAYIAGLLKYPLPKKINHKWSKRIERRKNYALYLENAHLRKKHNIKYVAIRSKCYKVKILI